MAANNPLFDFSQPRVMAILNVTPDSFFAGSRMPDAPHVERRVREAVEAGDKDAALEHLKAASRKLDKAVSKGVIHKNQAANRKSGMAVAINNM